MALLRSSTPDAAGFEAAARSEEDIATVETSLIACEVGGGRSGAVLRRGEGHLRRGELRGGGGLGVCAVGGVEGLHGGDDGPRGDGGDEDLARGGGGEGARRGTGSGRARVVDGDTGRHRPARGSVPAKPGV